MNTRDTLLAFGEWLDSEGVITRPAKGDVDQRSYEELAAEFIMHWESNLDRARLAGRSIPILRAGVEESEADTLFPPATFRGDMICRPSGKMLEDVAKLLEAEGGAFGIVFSPGPTSHWTAALEWGQEAPDSPMAAAAAYGTDKVAAAAIEACLDEAGI